MWPSREQWLEARRPLLAQEQESDPRPRRPQRQPPQAADGQSGPGVRVRGPDGPVTLAELFRDKQQLIVQHVMFGPDWDQPCPGCSAAIDEVSPGVIAHMDARETAFVLASASPTTRSPRRPRSAAGRSPGTPATAATSTTTTGSRWTSPAARWSTTTGPSPACSAASGPARCRATAASCARGEEIFHTYSVYGRGTEYVGNTYTFLLPHCARPPGGLGGAQLAGSPRSAAATPRSPVRRFP